MNCNTHTFILSSIENDNIDLENCENISPCSHNISIFFFKQPKCRLAESLSISQTFIKKIPAPLPVRSWKEFRIARFYSSSSSDKTEKRLTFCDIFNSHNLPRAALLYPRNIAISKHENMYKKGAIKRVLDEHIATMSSILMLYCYYIFFFRILL